MPEEGKTMHLLHYCPHSGGFMYDWHSLHFLAELECQGYTITDCNPVKQLGRLGSAAEYSEILVQTAKHVVNTPGPHLLLAASGKDTNIEVSAIDQIRKMGIPTVNLCFDANTVPFLYKKVGAYFDIVWLPDFGIESKLHQYGCNTVFMPYAANPYFFQPRGFKRDHVLCFLGSRFGARPQYIAKLSQADVPLRIRGNGWSSGAVTASKPGTRSRTLSSLVSLVTLLYEYAQLPAGRKVLAGAVKRRLGWNNKSGHVLLFENIDLGPGVPFDEMVSTYSSCTASLGVLEVASTYVLPNPLYQVRLRDFEAPMMGCAHLVYRVPELQQSFEENSEMIFYDSVEECVDKARYYLAPQQRSLVEAIGSRARERCLREHTWSARFRKLREILGI